MNAPERLTPTQRLHEVTMASLARRPSEPESSVTISRNAKGVAQFEVTVRGTDITACDAMARNVFMSLEQAWPYQVSTNGAAE